MRLARPPSGEIPRNPHALPQAVNPSRPPAVVAAMQGFITHAIVDGGYLAILALMALENIIPPIPSEAIMGLGGVMVAKGRLEFWPLLVVGTIGSTMGNLPWFWLANRLGYRRLEPFINRWGRWLTVEWHDVERGSRFLRHHGQWVVFAGRCSPFFRTLISVPAGLAHMPLWRFLAFTFLGGAAWNVLLIAGGSLLGRYVEQSQQALGWVILATTVIGVAYYLWRLAAWRRRRREKPA
jgi:membrane protein DedA with SNARE-associated domain